MISVGLGIVLCTGRKCPPGPAKLRPGPVRSGPLKGDRPAEVHTNTGPSWPSEQKARPDVAINGIDFLYVVFVNLLTQTNFEAYMGYIDRSTSWLALLCRPTQNKY